MRQRIEPERTVLRPIFDQEPFSSRPKCYRSVNPLGSVTVSVRTQFSYINGDDPGKGKEFFCSPKLPDGLWGPTSLLFNGNPRSFSGGKATGSDVDHSQPPIAGVKTEYSYTSISPMSLRGMASNNLVLYERHPS